MAAGRRALALIVAAIAVAAPAGEARAQEPSPVSDAARQLAERFAPIFMLKEQEEDCDADGEPYRPGLVDIVLDNPEIVLRQVGVADPVVTRGPVASDLHGLNDGFYLDFPGAALAPGCTFERDFWKYTGELPAAVYAHVVQQPDVPDAVFVQYWIYWYYNDWNNKHESDWEGIMLRFDATSVEEALESEPASVGFAQHDGGERADWDDPKLEREGDHPVVYPSAGSHASYFGSAVYLGRGTGEGFGCDTTTGPHDRVVPEVVVLPDRPTGPDDPYAWLAFNGRWGERQGGAFNGPTGPAQKGRYLEPAPWFDGLRDDSVVIPGGESSAGGLISTFCDVVERGSRTFIRLKLSPTQVLVTLVALALVARFAVRRTAWDEVEPQPIRRRRRVGQILRAALEAYQRQPIVFLAFGLVYIPAAFLAGAIGALLDLIPAFDRLRAVLGGAAGTNLLVALLIGSFVHLAAFMVVNSMVADYMDGDRGGLNAAIDSARRVWSRRRQIAGPFALAYGTVAVLLLSTILAPIGIYLLVRYQFLGQVVMLEDRTGTAALARSGALVRKRWFHTAIVASFVNGVVVVGAALLGLVLLVVAPGFPLWAFSAISAVIYAVSVPFAALSMTLLYGDAVAEQAGEPAAYLVRKRRAPEPTPRPDTVDVPG